MGTVRVEAVSWTTKFVGGNGTGRVEFEEPLPAGATLRSVLQGLSSRYPDLRAALWEDGELGEHIEVVVNDAMLGITHSIDSPLSPGDRVSLLGQFTGGSGRR